MIEAGDFKRLEGDATQWFQLRHPNIVKLLGACSSSGSPFFVYELQAGVKYLNEFLDAVNDESDRKAATWKCFYEAALGLQYLPSRGVIHGDLRCENILVSSDATVKLGGLRLFTLYYAGQEQSSSKWHSPEMRWNKIPALSVKSDVFAFGMCIWEAARREASDSEDDGGFRYRSETMGDAEWDLISKMCAEDTGDRVDTAYVVSRLKQFVLDSSSRTQRGEQNESGDASPSSTLAVSRFDTGGGIVSSIVCSHIQWLVRSRMC